MSLARRLVEYSCFYLGASWRLLRLPRQDVIVSLTTPPFIAWTAILHKILHPRCRLVLWNMDCYPDLAERMELIHEGRWPSRCLKGLNRRLFRYVDWLVCLDHAMAELLLRQYAPKDRQLQMAVIPNWEEKTEFPSEARATWKEAGDQLTRDRFVVLYLGNAGAGHQFDTVLRAAEELRQDPVLFLFVGGGSRWEEIAEESEARGLENVFMRPYVPKQEKLEILGSADCALITLRDSAVGVVSPSKLHASLAAGLPILYIGPEGSNVDEAVARFACGESIRNGDWKRVVGFIRSMTRDQKRYGELARTARQSFESAYCDERTLPQFDSVLERVSLPPVIVDGEGIRGSKDTQRPRARMSER